MTEARPAQSRNIQILRRVVPVAVLVLGFVSFFAFDLDRYVSFDALRDNRADLLQYVGENILWASAIYFAVYVVSVAFSLPGGAILSLGGGFLFGTVLGSILTVTGATIGATLLFMAAKTALGDILRRRAGGAVSRMAEGFRENAFSYLLSLRLIPVFPFWLVNLVPAFLGVRLRDYVIATFFGIIPGTVVFVSVGSGLGAVFDAGGEPNLGIIFKPEILIPLIALAALASFPAVYKRWRTRRSRNEGRNTHDREN